MAYGLNYLSRMQQTQNLDKTLNAGSGMVDQSRPQMWVYNASSNGANNSKAETVAANYFLGAYGYLTVGDIIYCVCNNGAQMLYVSAVSSSSVTTSAGWSV